MRREELIQTLERLAPEAVALREPPNAPLTLEELREMDGEPVWVKDFFESHGSWMLVCPDYCENHWGVELYCDYGETWLAYRRRLEDGIL